MATAAVHLLAARACKRPITAIRLSMDAIALAAAYTVAILQNHPFADGNKRTGFLSSVLFLELNGMAFTASEEAAAEAVLKLAAGQSDEVAYRALLSDHSSRISD